MEKARGFEIYRQIQATLQYGITLLLMLEQRNRNYFLFKPRALSSAFPLINVLETCHMRTLMMQVRESSMSSKILFRNQMAITWAIQDRITIR